MASTYYQNQLQTYLQGVDHDQLDIVQFDWGYVHQPMTQTAGYLSDNVTTAAQNIGGKQLSEAITENFTKTSTHLHDRATKIQKAASSLDTVNARLKKAKDDLDKWAADPLGAAPTEPKRTDMAYDNETDDTAFNQDHANWKTANDTYEENVGDRETAAQTHITNIDSAMDDAIAAMKDIHQQPDPDVPGGGAGGAAGGGGGPFVPTENATPPPPIVVTPTKHPTERPPVEGETDPTAPWQPVHQTPGTPVTTGPVGHGGGGVGGGWGHVGGDTGGGSTYDGGSTTNGPDPVGATHSSGLPGGLGLGAAALGGGLVAGVGGVAGVRALGGLGSLSEEGLLGVSGRGTGVPGLLGKGAVGAVPMEGEEGAAGGRIAATGTAGGRGAAGSGRGRAAGSAAGGRGGRGKKGKDGDHDDLWDDGQDWIDDEGAAPGVLD